MIFLGYELVLSCTFSVRIRNYCFIEEHSFYVLHNISADEFANIDAVADRCL
jgi:hypothetical protein